MEHSPERPHDPDDTGLTNQHIDSGADPSKDGDNILRQPLVENPSMEDEREILPKPDKTPTEELLDAAEEASKSD